MVDENLQNDSSVNDVDNTNYIDAIKQLKENSVARDKYDQLKAENKKLLDSIVNGQEIELTQKQGRSIDEIRNDLFNHEHNNLEYVKTALELRNALIDAGERDPFLPWGSKIAPDANDYACAEKVAQVYQECIDYADGDSQLFTQELQRRTNPTIFDSVVGQKNNKIRK